MVLLKSINPSFNRIGEGDIGLDRCIGSFPVDIVPNVGALQQSVIRESDVNRASVEPARL